MKNILWIVALTIMTACWPFRYTEVSVATGPEWYTYCSWDYPCWYPNNVVFIYGWGYFPQFRYIWWSEHPSERVWLKRNSFVPRRHPKHSDWDDHVRGKESRSERERNKNRKH